MRQMRAEELVRLFDSNHQRCRFFALVTHRRFGQLDIFAVYPAGEDVRDQHILQRLAVIPEFQNNIHIFEQAAHDLLHGIILVVGIFDQEAFALLYHPAQLTFECAQRHRIGPAALGELFDAIAIHLQQGGQPLIFEVLL